MIRALVALMFLALPVQAGCGPDPAPCVLPDGTYHTVLPPETAQGAVVFLHGYGGSGEGALTNTGMVRALGARGYAVIAPDGQLGAMGDRRSWALRSGDGTARDDTAFIRAVADDAARRFALPRDRIVLAGFSVGGSMVAYAACADPVGFAAYAPVAGNFWRPYPTSCAGPVRMLHVHGWSDGTVPLEGRRLRADLEQGDVFAALEIWRRTDRCPKNNPNRMVQQGDFLRRTWENCAPGSGLEFVLHPGGHMIPPGWADLMLDWFEAR